MIPVISGFGVLAGLPWEHINDKIERRVLAGEQGMIVWWKIKAGARAAPHRHPHEQIVWMLKGRMDFRIGNEQRSMSAGDVAVIPGDIEHEGFFPEDTDVVDVFSPPRVRTSWLGAHPLTCVHREVLSRLGNVQLDKWK